MSRSIGAWLLVWLLLYTFLALTSAHGGANDGALDQVSPTDSSTDTPNLRARGLILVKIWCLIIVFFGTFLGGVSPYFFRWDEMFLVLGTQFAGGVFLGTALMHFLSDSNSTFKTLSDKDYPFAYMLTSAGYLLTMLGDCIINWIFVKEVAAGRVDVERGGSPATASKDVAAMGKEKHNDSISHIQNINACECGDPVTDNQEARTIVKATLVKTASFGDTLLLILALCFHSVFEGIAIGVAESQHDAWRALWTVCLHKIFAAIAMGIALLRMIPDRPFLSCAAYAFAFAISSPVGVAIGIIIDSTTQGRVADWIYAISMGIACGVFLYVAINHLLGKGYSPGCQIPMDTPFFRFLAVVLGVGVIAVVMNWD